jgi:hypothetical protein
LTVWTVNSASSGKHFDLKFIGFGIIAATEKFFEFSEFFAEFGTETSLHRAGNFL